MKDVAFTVIVGCLIAFIAVIGGVTGAYTYHKLQQPKTDDERRVFRALRRLRRKPRSHATTYPLVQHQPTSTQVMPKAEDDAPTAMFPKPTRSATLSRVSDYQ